jgi:hypothetical protein
MLKLVRSLLLASVLAAEPYMVAGRQSEISKRGRWRTSTLIGSPHE